MSNLNDTTILNIINNIKNINKIYELGNNSEANNSNNLGISKGKISKINNTKIYLLPVVLIVLS